MQGTDDKENKPVQLSLVPVRGEVSDSDDDLAFSIKEKLENCDNGGYLRKALLAICYSKVNND